MDLRQKVEQFVIQRDQYHKLERQTIEEIREAFEREIPALNAKLPSEVRITEYLVNKQGRALTNKPTIIIPFNGSNDEQDYISQLNQSLADDYLRFEEQYGVTVEGFARINRIG